MELDGGPAVAASIELEDEALTIVPEGSAATRLALVDIDDVHDDDYTLRLTDHTGRSYALSMLGKAYGQLAVDLRKRRDAVLERDLLLRGVNLRDTYPGKLFGGPEPVPVELRVYEDLLVVVPQRGTMFGIPFSFVDRVDWDEELYQARVVCDDGRTVVLGHLAKRSEEFRDELRRLLDGLARRTAATLEALLPGVDPGVLAQLGAIMRDGRAVQRVAVDAVDPSVWPRLEEAAAGTEELRETYERLTAMTPAGWAAFGVKAVLPEAEASGDPAGAVAERNGEKATDLWYFCPLSIEGRRLNAVAHEVASGGGHATYVFRLMEPERFSSLAGGALAEAVAGSIARLNRALLQLNFRREPVYLPEERMAEGRFARYRVALRKLEYLRWARETFLGRAIHDAGWESQLRTAAGRA